CSHPLRRPREVLRPACSWRGPARGRRSMKGEGKAHAGAPLVDAVSRATKNPAPLPVRGFGECSGCFSVYPDMRLRPAHWQVMMTVIMSWAMMASGMPHGYDTLAPVTA